MSKEKKLIRQRFRDACFARDNYSCVMCDFKSSKENAEKELDAHHITDRNELPNRGYVKENGISLCSSCHEKAEEFHSTGNAHPGYSIDDLYKKINSDLQKAIAASKRIK
jgi:5-methylcytosine-specific restriction endonuclease McrA